MTLIYSMTAKMLSLVLYRHFCLNYWTR